MIVSPSVAERSEAEAVFQMETGGPESVRSALGMNATRIGDAVVLSMRNDPTHYWSKALGFGRTAPVTAELIHEVCAFYRAEGSPQAILQLAPSVIPQDWTEICAREGITAGSSWVKLVAEVDDAVAHADAPDRRQADGLRVARVSADDADEWASVTLRSFGMPEEHYTGMVAATVGRAGWHAYGVWLGRELVGAGNVFHDGDIAEIFGNAVLPHARNRGGQSELLAASARTAAMLGCRLLVAETATETDEGDNSSLHNVLRFGFKVVYERRNWMWQPTT